MTNGAGAKERRALQARQPWNNPRVRDLFEELTAEQTGSAWALRARQIVIEWRRVHGESPTWQELFTELACDDSDRDERRVRAWTDRWLRTYTLVHWRRNHWIHFTKHHRSLRLQPPPQRPRRRMKTGAS